jgi:hypothetical protein
MESSFSWLLIPILNEGRLAPVDRPLQHHL